MGSSCEKGRAFFPLRRLVMARKEALSTQGAGGPDGFTRRKKKKNDGGKGVLFLTSTIKGGGSSRQARHLREVDRRGGKQGPNKILKVKWGAGALHQKTHHSKTSESSKGSRKERGGRRS